MLKRLQKGDVSEEEELEELEIVRTWAKFGGISVLHVSAPRLLCNASVLGLLKRVQDSKDFERS
jgi:hypothetical protein